MDLHARGACGHRVGEFFCDHKGTECGLTDFPQPSPKVAVLRFRRGMQQGLLGRISRSAVKEYHAFGIISWVYSDMHTHLLC